MRIALLAKKDKYSDYLDDYLIGRGHLVVKTDGKLSLEDLGKVDIGISWFYKHILRQPELDAVKLGILNNHPAYLPWGRGAMPNVWAILGEPAGVTLHYMTAKVDEGDIVAQRRVTIEPDDNAQTLYLRLVEEQYKLFLEFWPTIESLGNSGLKAPSIPQPKLQPNTLPWPTHRVRDVAQVDDLGRYDDARYYIDILRARTFPGHEAAYFTVDNQKYYVRVSIEKAPPAVS